MSFGSISVGNHAVSEIRQQKKKIFFSQYECVFHFFCFKMSTLSFQGAQLCFRPRQEIKYHVLLWEAVLVVG